MLRKLSTLAIVASMLCVSLSFISFNVYSEDVPGPFADRSNGYPLESLDVDFPSSSSQATVSSSLWESQTFKPTVNGKLNKLSVKLWQGSSIVNLYCGIYSVKSGDPDVELTSETVLGVDVPPVADWVDIEFSSPADLTSGTPYAIVLYTTLNSALWKRYASADIYLDGEAQTSNDYGATWTPIVYDFTFRTYMQTADSGLKKIAWHPDGKYALAVSGQGSDVYRYDRETTTWSLEDEPDPDVIFNDIVWDDFYNEFYMVGLDESLGRGAAYKYDGTTFTNLLTTTSLSKFYSVASCGGYGDYNFLAVGEDSHGENV